MGAKKAFDEVELGGAGRWEMIVDAWRFFQ